MQFSILFLTYLLLILSTYTLQAQSTTVVLPDSKAVYVGKYMEVYEDVNHLYTIQQLTQANTNVAFTALATEVPNFQITPATYWLRFNVKSTIATTWVLAIDKGDIDYLTLYEVKDNKVVDSTQVGNLVPVYLRAFQTHQFFFPVQFAQEETKTFYIKVQSSKPLAVPLQIDTQTATLRAAYLQTLLQGLYIGFVLFIALYNLFIYFSVKDSIYLIYVTYVVLLGIVILDFKGLTASLLFAATPAIMPYTIVFYGIAGALADIFSIFFLQTHQYPKYNKIIIGFIGVYLLSSLLGLLGFVLLSCVLVNVNAFVSAISLLYMAYRIYRNGNTYARFYLYAFGLFLLGVIAQFLGNIGVLPANQFTLQVMQFGSAAEMLLLSLALADKINRLKAEKEATQEELLTVLQEQNSALEEGVKERTHQLQNAYSEIEVQNEELKQQQEELLATNEALAQKNLTIQEQNLVLENKTQTIADQKLILENTFQDLQKTTDRLNANIRYAQKVQQVILPTKNILNSFFAEHFILYLPKDIVSGDFYWFTTLNNAQESMTRAIFVLADCTGHGVAGAFMSMVGNTLLYETIETQKITNPSEILHNLHKLVQKALHQKDGQNRDGMDISVCLLEKQADTTVKTTFAGAKTSILYTAKDNLVKKSGDRIFIGGEFQHTDQFTNHSFVLNQGEILYLYSDGYADQNDHLRNRLGSVVFTNILAQNKHLPLQQQQEQLLKALQTHQRTESQRDDITVVGLRL
jgi:serine phosphatase RsbU (regulator of sigma subunit)